jgi:hypothetical protein
MSCRLYGYRSPQCNGLFNRTIYRPVLEEEGVGDLYEAWSLEPGNHAAGYSPVK